MKSFLSQIVLIGVFLLTGCANTFSSKVTTENNWPSTLETKSFKIDQNAEYGESPEFIHAAEDVKTRLIELGFVEANSVDLAALKVNVQLSTTPGNTHVSMPFGPMNYIVTPTGAIIPLNGFGTSLFAPRFIRSPQWRFYTRGSLYSMRYDAWSNPFYSPYYFGRRLDPFYANELSIRQSFEHQLSITIIDSKTSKTMYKVDVKTDQYAAEIDEHISQLVESALKGFPNKNGSEHQTLHNEK
jgi:hypothetical protein